MREGEEEGRDGGVRERGKEGGREGERERHTRQTDRQTDRHRQTLKVLGVCDTKLSVCLSVCQSGILAAESSKLGVCATQNCLSVLCLSFRS
jgi:hypothetical protein